MVYHNNIAGMIVSVVDPRPGESIVDGCAAPGGKTLYMASRLSRKGKLCHFLSVCLFAPFSVKTLNIIAMLDELSNSFVLILQFFLLPQVW